LKTIVGTEKMITVHNKYFPKEHFGRP